MHDRTTNFIPKFQLVLSPISRVGSNSRPLPLPRSLWSPNHFSYYDETASRPLSTSAHTALSILA